MGYSKPKPILSKEERDILLLVAVHPGSKHLTNGEIGKRLGIAVTRVKTLIHQACIKLEARNRNEAVFLAMKRGEIKLNELLTLDEIAEILCSVDSDVLRMIANYIRYNRKPGILPEMDEKTIYSNRKQTRMLTNRERDVLILVKYGHSNTEIAEELYMTTSAVRTFLNRAFKKLGARKRADAVQLALKQREICISEISSFDELYHFLAPLGADSIENIAQLLDEKFEKESISTTS
jgi:DNA-binding CsgD family transcriptional regulator